MFDPDVWGTVADWVVAGAALASGYFVVTQLELLRAERMSEAATARADLLFRIDEQFEDGKVFESREAWLALRARYRQLFSTAAPHERDRLIQGGIADELNRLWDDMQRPSDALSDLVTKYARIMRLPGWIETVGMFAREHLIDPNDVLELYESVILVTMEPIELHLEHRLGLRTASHSVLENAVWILNRAKQARAAGDDPELKPDRKQGRTWPG